MKIYTFLLIATFLVSGCVNKTNDDSHKMENTTKQLRHVVMFKFKDSTSSADIKKVEVAFAALPSKISEIKDFEWGLNNSPEGINKGLTHCFFLTFDSEESRAVYLPHPAHLEFGKVLKPFLEDVLVLDYWNK
jgi:hypothetical protein